MKDDDVWLMHFPEYVLTRRKDSLFLKVARRHQTPYSHAGSPAASRPAIEAMCSRRPTEVLGILMLDASTRLLGGIIVATGNRSRVDFSLEHLVVPPMLRPDCTGIILFHNHLGESAEPSDAELKMFDWVRREWPGLALLHDNCISSDGDFFSFREAGYFLERMPKCSPAIMRKPAGRQPASDQISSDPPSGNLREIARAVEYETVNQAGEITYRVTRVVEAV